jgi:hypothetical protein
MGKSGFYFLVLFFSLIIFSSSRSAVRAQENPKGFSLNPFFQEVNLDTEQKEFKFNLEISNQTAAPAVFYLSALDFGALSESGGVAFLGAGSDYEKKYGLASWISLSKDALVVGSGETQVVPVTIENKESLSPGGHYAAIVLKQESDKSDESAENSRVSLKSSFASLIFARKIGGGIEEMALKEKSFERHIFRLPKTINLRFQNVGNVHLTPRGVVKIIDPLGRDVAKAVINGESSLVLPETFRIFFAPVKKTALAFVPGRYTAEISYRYDGREAFESERENFWLIPPLFLLLLALIAAAIFHQKIAKIFLQKNKKQLKTSDVQRQV